MRARVVPVLAILGALVVIWYLGAIWGNSSWTIDQAARDGREVSFSEIVSDAMAQKRPVVPAPHQVAADLYSSVFEKKPTSPRSLIYHAQVTLGATMLGFSIGGLLGIGLAVAIVHNKVMELCSMPWIIASQTVPVLAIAPMVIVVLGSLGFKGLIPKALIAAYLSFFPVVVGMIKGLRSPDAMAMDLMKTYNASEKQVFRTLRLPSSLPFLFASLKVSMAASVVGVIVAELPSGALAGLGARLLTGSYYGQTVQIWSALIMAAALAACMVALIGVMERMVNKRLGVRP